MLVFVGIVVQMAGIKISHAHFVLLVYLVFGTDTGAHLVQMHGLVQTVVQLYADEGIPVHAFLVILKLQTMWQPSPVLPATPSTP